MYDSLSYECALCLKLCLLVVAGAIVVMESSTGNVTQISISAELQSGGLVQFRRWGKKNLNKFWCG